MRKAQRQEILEMLQTLEEAHREIKENIDRKNAPLAQDLLTQCQECAITIGNTIEKLEGEGFVTVSCVEAYCDAVYTAYEELNGNNQNINGNKVYKNLRKQLLRIENSVKNDIPIRKEIAFFPYKASMWDSLESVYLAAKEDPNCDAYCVPIPYYDRNPDRSLGQMHYEGREYPKNIEVIDYQTYNFETRRPDVIYIHNPYDDWNLVTCVPPRYFSSNLTKYTEKLVYIPYFVLDEIEPDDQVRINSMKHFCTMPGVVNSDRVILQSEKMRQIYINEYIKLAQANGFPPIHTDRKFLEEKFLGTGSPKFDKVQNTKKEDLEIPESWLKIIEKPDGSWKKIIFYNTSIAALLENREKMLGKIQDVFQVFKENKEQVALLWRPHPLIKSTISSMLPQLWVEYEKIVNQYKTEGWGIYDDSSDMDRAVVLSDAYYGDYSSVVQVYQKTGKPVMIQSAIRNESSNARLAATNDICIVDNKIYFFHVVYNALFSVDMMSKEMIYECDVKTEDNEKLLYGEMACWDKIIMFAPMKAKHILIYDTEENSVKTIEIEKYVKNEKGNRKYKKCIENKDEIILLPYGSRTILFLNKNTLQVRTDLKWYEKFKKIYGDRSEYLIEGDIFQKDGVLYCILNECNAFMKYNLSNGNVSFVEVGEKEEILSAMCNAEEKIWILTKYGKIYEYSMKTEESKYICTISIGEKDIFTAQYVENKKEIVFFPKNNDMIYTLDISNSKVKETEIVNGKVQRLAKRIGEDIYCYIPFTRGLWKYDLEKHVLQQADIYVNRESILNIASHTKVQEDDNSRIGIKDFCESIICKQD